MPTLEQTMTGTFITYTGGPLDGQTRRKTERARTSTYRDATGAVMEPRKGDRIVQGRSATRSVYVLTDDVRQDGQRTLTYTYTGAWR
jgi:hypothetical protein